MPIIYAQYLYWYWYLKVKYWYLYWYWYWYWYLFVEYLIQDCILDDDEVNDDLRGTKLILDCDAPSGKMNFSLNSVFVRPFAMHKRSRFIIRT